MTYTRLAIDHMVMLSVCLQGNGGIIPIVAYSSIDKSDQSIPGFPVVYPVRHDFLYLELSV